MAVIPATTAVVTPAPDAIPALVAIPATVPVEELIIDFAAMLVADFEIYLPATPEISLPINAAAVRVVSVCSVLAAMASKADLESVTEKIS